jgi:hypothetical protein
VKEWRLIALEPPRLICWNPPMALFHRMPAKSDIAVTPSARTRHAELLRLCARIGYSPPASR